MEETRWKQVNIAYPSPDPQERERQAVDHLSRVLPAAEANGLVASWWFIRKGRWRVRYLLAADTKGNDPVHPLLTGTFTWNDDIYEPEIHAFGGPASMKAAHALFHRDSRHLLTFSAATPTTGGNDPLSCVPRSCEPQVWISMNKATSGRESPNSAPDCPTNRPLRTSKYGHPSQRTSDTFSSAQPVRAPSQAIGSPRSRTPEKNCEHFEKRANSHEGYVP